MSPQNEPIFPYEVLLQADSAKEVIPLQNERDVLIKNKRKKFLFFFSVLFGNNELIRGKMTLKNTHKKASDNVNKP